MSMTRRDFYVIAEALHRAKPDDDDAFHELELEVWANVCDHVKDACANQSNNGRFKHDLFSKVCVDGE